MALNSDKIVESKIPTATRLYCLPKTIKDSNLVCYKSVNLPASQFMYGCICGHRIVFRDILSKPRCNTNNRIVPKVEPIPIQLRNY